VIFPTYKWLLGPYGRAFIYIARRHQHGIPLEQTGFGRREIRSDAEIYFTDLGYVGGGRRFDMGQRDHFISMEMAAIGMEMMAEWGAAAVAERLAVLTGRIAEGLDGTKVRIMDARFRAPHILSLAFAGGLPGGWSRSWPPTAFMLHRGWRGCGSRRMFSTTRKTSTVLSQR
jgi:selenocysteine lyase/cysteine desulfurase